MVYLWLILGFLVAVAHTIPFIAFDDAQYRAVEAMLPHEHNAHSVAKMLQRPDALHDSWPMAWFQLGLRELVERGVVHLYSSAREIPDTQSRALPPERAPQSTLSMVPSYSIGSASTQPIGVRVVRTRVAEPDRAGLVQWMRTHAQWAIGETYEQLPPTLAMHSVPQLRETSDNTVTLPVVIMHGYLTRLVAAPPLPTSEVETALRCGGDIYVVDVDELRATLRAFV